MRPWLSFLSGLVTVGLGVASLGLMFLQPVVVHSWCTWCLFSAVLILVVLQRALPEFLAFIQSWILLKRSGMMVLPWFLHGATPSQFSLLGAKTADLNSTRAVYHPWTEGTHCIWTLMVSFLLGSFTLALPDLFHIQGFARVSLEVAGVVSVGISLISMCDPVRCFRSCNAAAGLILFSFYIGKPDEPVRWISGAIGAFLVALCLHPGRTEGNYGLFDRPLEL